MTKTRSRFVWPLVPLLLLAAAWAACGQGLGPEVYGIVAEFGMSAPTPTRQLGMGAPITCLDDVQYANPAFAAVRRVSDASVRLNLTDLERGPLLTSVLANYSYALHPGQSGLQFSVLDLSSSGGDTVLPGLGPVTVDMSENAFVVDYGRRLGEKLTGGLSVLGSNRVELHVDNPLAPLLDLGTRMDYGGRVGLAYEWLPGDFLGLLYSFAQDTVHTNGAMTGGVERRTIFHSDQLAVGASRHLNSEVLVMVEFQRATLRNASFHRSVESWQLGGEYQVTPQWALRAGSDDGAPTFGLGYSDSRWRVDYAFLQDWKYASSGRLFGGSDTHSVQASYCW